METNTKFIQIRGKLETDRTLSLGQDVRVLVTVTSEETQDQDDGSVNVIYKAKLFEVLEDE